MTDETTGYSLYAELPGFTRKIYWAPKREEVNDYLDCVIAHHENYKFSIEQDRPQAE